jgi:thymidylate synthase ThyX
VRHRIASYTVESTRFTLKKILKYKNLDSIVNELTYCPTEKIKEKTKVDFQFIIDEMKNNPKVKNDILKYYLPENYLVNRIAFTINFR